MNYQPWIWTELLAFDNIQEDFGVKKYLDKTGFIPKVICLMFSSPDIVLQHEALNKERDFPADLCSRDAHEGNEERKRQVWTNFQLKSLVDNLHNAGVEVYLSLFTVFYKNKYHHEWMSDHPEALQEWDFQGKGLNLNVTHRFKDGTYIEDFFIDKVVQTTQYYGFDGWHGPDGYGPLTTGSLAYTDCSDDIMGQFTESLDCQLPDCINCCSNEDLPTLQKRMKWIWNNLRKEWIQFNTDRWASFWTKVTSAMHKVNKKTAINSAWTKACFEAEYRYGIDYKKIMKAQVDYMVVETVAASCSLWDAHGYDYHYEYLAMLMEIKAYAPKMKLITLHGVKDVVENWDVLRHAPTMLEQEFYSLANVYYNGKRVSDGFLTCLGDGIKTEEWSQLRKLWDYSFAGKSQKQGTVTVIWSDNVHSKLLDDYLQHGTWNTAKQMQSLMERGVQIQNIDRIENIDNITGTVFVANSHLLNLLELQKIKGYRNGEVIMTERKADKYICKTLNKDISSVAYSFKDDKPPLSFFEPMSYCTINDDFWDEIIKAMNSFDSLVKTDDKNVSFMTQIIDENTFILAIKNKIFTYLCPKIIFAKDIKELQIISIFPHTKQSFSDKSFILKKLPPKGIVIIKVRLKK
jgi:hypothetical protein